MEKINIGRGKKDTDLFESHLRMPFSYFNLISEIHNRSLAAVPFKIHEILEGYHAYQRRSMDRNKDYVNLVKLGGIPPQFAIDTPKVTGRKECLDTLNSLIKNINKFVGTGVTLYLNSPFETSAIAAASLLFKEIDKLTDVSWEMVSYPRYVELSKEFSDSSKTRLASYDYKDVLCLYMVGKEYTSEFNLAAFKSLLSKRRVAKKVTLLCSHLSEDNFSVRYGSDICISSLPFTDESEINNYKTLRRIVEG